MTYSLTYFNFIDLIAGLLKEHTKEQDKQAKDVFTTLCLFWDIEADTYKCDNLIKELLEKSNRNNENFEEFYNYMVQDII